MSADYYGKNWSHLFLEIGHGTAQLTQAVHETGSDLGVMEFVDINTIDDQLQLNKLTTAIDVCRPFYVHIRVPCGDQQVNLHDAWFAELTSTLAQQINSMQLFVTIELEPGTRQWLLKPYKNLKLQRQFVHAGNASSLLTNAPWIVPLFSLKAVSAREKRWTRLHGAAAPAPTLYPDKLCRKLVTTLCAEASQRRLADRDLNFRSISSLSLLGCWPAFPLYFTSGDIEESRISSITADSDELLIAPIIKSEDQKELEREREKDEEFRYMCEWLAKQSVPAVSITYKCEKPQGCGAEWYVVNFESTLEKTSETTTRKRRWSFVLMVSTTESR